MKCHLCNNSFDTLEVNFGGLLNCIKYYCSSNACYNNFPIGNKCIFIVKDKAIIYYNFCYKHYSINYSIIDNASKLKIINNNIDFLTFDNILELDNIFTEINDLNLIKEKFDNILKLYLYK